MNEIKQIVRRHHQLRHIARGASARAASWPEAILPRQQSASTNALWLHEQLSWTTATQGGSLRHGCDQLLAMAVVNAAGRRSHQSKSYRRDHSLAVKGIPLEIQTGALSPPGQPPAPAERKH